MTLILPKMLPRNPIMEADTAKTARHIMGTGIVLLGVMFIAAGLIIGLEFPAYVAQKVRENVCITSPASLRYPQWLVDYNSTKKNSIMIWNLTNPKQVSQNSAHPQWSLIGPYVYTESERKLDIQFRDGYIEYVPWITQTWDEQATALLCGTNCSLDAEITVVSPWMVSNASLPPMTIARALFMDYKHAKLKDTNNWFIRLTVRRFVLGHYRNIMSADGSDRDDKSRNRRLATVTKPAFLERTRGGELSVQLVRLGTHPMALKTLFHVSASNPSQAIKEWTPGILRHFDTENEAMTYGHRVKLRTCPVDRSLDSNLYWQEVKWGMDWDWSSLKGHGWLIPPGPEPRSCINTQPSKQLLTIAWPTLFQSVEMKAVKQEREAGNPPTWLYEVSKMKNETWIDPISRYYYQLESKSPPLSEEPGLRAGWVPFQVHIEPVSGLVWQRSVSVKGFAMLPNNTLWPQIFVARTETITEPHILKQRHYSVILLQVACGGMAGFTLVGAAIVVTGICLACFRRPQNRITPIVTRRPLPLQQRPATNPSNSNN